MEKWMPIKGYEGLYEVSNLGRVRSLHYNKIRILKQSHDKRGYPIVDLRKSGTRWTVHVHRLVASVFIQNPLEKATVNHKNEIKTDNSVCNLEWCTNKENINHGKRNEKVSAILKKPVVMLDKNSNVIASFDSMKSAAKYGFNQTAISLCCNGKRKSHKNYIWRFDN